MTIKCPICGNPNVDVLVVGGTKDLYYVTNHDFPDLITGWTAGRMGKIANARFTMACPTSGMKLEK